MRRLASVTAADEAPEPRPPALLVRGDDFEDPPPEWHVLNERRNDIQNNLASVGRIREKTTTLGTGFLVARDVVMTNRHVAEAFATDVDRVLKLRFGWQPSIDFSAEQDGSSRVRYPIKSILYADDVLDLALLRIAIDKPVPPTPRTTAPTADEDEEPVQTPEPLPLATTAPPADRRPVYLIGFPDEDPFAGTEELFGVFQNVFDVKRVQPGYLNRVLIDEREIGHTCSTLRGNSGSPVIDVETNKVIGLHRRGSRERVGQPAANEAIGLWLLPPTIVDHLRYLRNGGSGGNGFEGVSVVVSSH